MLYAKSLQDVFLLVDKIPKDGDGIIFFEAMIYNS